MAKPNLILGLSDALGLSKLITSLSADENLFSKYSDPSLYRAFWTSQRDAKEGRAWPQEAYSPVGKARLTSLTWVEEKPRKCLTDETAKRSGPTQTEGIRGFLGRPGVQLGPASRWSKICKKTIRCSISANPPGFTTGTSGHRILRNRRKRTR